jgi:hypothetical protein
MIDDLCANGFCEGKQPDIYKICQDFQATPGSVQKKTDFQALCSDLDYELMCTNSTYSANLCPTGRSIANNWCAQYPESCDSASSTWSNCTDKVYDCVASREARWGYFTERFPELKKEHSYSSAVFANSSSLHEYICRNDSSKFCRGGKEFAIQDVCQNWESIPELVKNETSLISACISDWPKACTDPEIKDKICTDGKNIAFDICPILAEGACDETSDNEYAKHCGRDWVNCVAHGAQFCQAFPELCPRFEGQKFNNLDDLGDAICAGDANGVICEFNQEKNKASVRNSSAVCDNRDQLSEEIKTGSSVMAWCASEPRQICDNEGLAHIACKDGEFDFGNHTNFQHAYPDKVKFGSDTFDECAIDMSRCLLNPAWDFCADFPEFCNWPQTHFNRIGDLGRAICKADSKLFCNGTDDSPESAEVVCANLEKLPEEVVFKSSVLALCEADPAAICADSRYKQYNICKDGKFEFSAETACEMNPESCKFGDQHFDRCALSWTQCLIDP